MRFYFGAFLFLAVSFSFATEKVYAPYFALTNLRPDYQIASTKLLQKYSESVGRYEIILPSISDSSSTIDKDSVQRKAIEKGCSKFLIGDLTRLGETVIISVSLYNTTDGNRVWTDEMKVNTPDDLDPAIERFAKTLGTEKKTSGPSSDIYSVTNKERASLRKKQSNNFWGIGISGIALFSPDQDFVPGLECFWLYDTRTLLIKVDVAIHSSNSSSSNQFGLTDLGLAAYYPLFDTDISPYLGGGLIYGIAKRQNEHDNEVSATGLLFKAGGGMILNRTSSVILQLDLEYMISTFKFNNHLIQGPALTFEVGF